MNAEQINAEIGQPGARELLETATLLRLAYDGSDGFPRVIPVGFHWNGRAIVVCTQPTAPKVQSLRERPNVAMTIDAGDTPATARSVLLRGIARVEIVDGVADEYLAAAAKSMSDDELAEFERQVRGFYDQMARISVEPSWARFYDFGGGRLPAFLTKLVGGA